QCPHNPHNRPLTCLSKNRGGGRRCFSPVALRPRRTLSTSESSSRSNACASPKSDMPQALSTLRPSALATPSPKSLTRVLHVINGEPYSGAERVQDLLAGYLPACGYEASFACVKPDRFPTARRFCEPLLFELPMRGRFDIRCGAKVAQLI